MELLLLVAFVFPQGKLSEALARVGHASPPSQGESVRRAPLLAGPSAWREPAREPVGPNVLVVGDTPAETLFITGTYYLNEELRVINDGVVYVRNADAVFDCNVYLSNTGRFDMDSSTLNFVQLYHYQREVQLVDTASWEVRNSTLTYSGWGFNYLIIGWANFRVYDMVRNDWATHLEAFNSVTYLRNLPTFGEHILFGGLPGWDRETLTVSNSNDGIIWFWYPPGCTVSTSFPAGASVDTFRFDSTRSGISGLGYSVRVDTTTNVMWGNVSHKGSTVTLSNTYARTCGFFLTEGDTNNLAGLVNGQFYSDYTAPFSDRTFRLVNSTMVTWNVYPGDSTYTTLASSIFGELLTGGEAYCEVQGSMCDGTGGYVGTSDSSFSIYFGTSISTIVVANGRSLLLLANVAQWGWPLTAAGSSILALVNCNTFETPTALDTAMAWMLGVMGPSTGRVDDVVELFGSAWMTSGPYNARVFSRYELSYRAEGDTAWATIDLPVTAPVIRNTLASWNTAGLSPGWYELLLVVYDDAGDSLYSTSRIDLLPNTGAAERGAAPFAFTARQAGDELLFALALPATERVTLSLYDASGRLVGVPVSGTLGAGTRVFTYRPRVGGVYFARLERVGEIVRRKTTFIR